MVSYIADASGARLCLYTSRGGKSTTRKTKYICLNQIGIARKYWKIWTKSLCATFTSDGKSLVRILGDWLTEGEQSQR